MRKINVDQFKQYVEFLAAKDQSGNTMRPDDFNNVMQIAVIEYVENINTPTARENPNMKGLEATNAIKDALAHLLTPVFQSVGSNGILKRPENYMNWSSCRKPVFEIVPTLKQIAANGGVCCDKPQADTLFYYLQQQEAWVKVKLVSDFKRSHYLNSSLRRTSDKYPIVTLLGDFQFTPANIGYVLLTFYRYPETAKWGYTVVDGQEQYDKQISVDIDLPQTCAHSLALWVLSLMGIHNQDATVNQWTSFEKSAK